MPLMRAFRANLAINGRSQLRVKTGNSSHSTTLGHKLGVLTRSRASNTESDKSGVRSRSLSKTGFLRDIGGDEAPTLYCTPHQQHHASNVGCSD
eukprot:1129406-Amphidinium_carterae.1